MLLVVSIEKVHIVYLQFQIFLHFQLSSLFHEEKDNLRQQKSLGAAVSFLVMFCCSFALSSFIKQCPPRKSQVWWKHMRWRMCIPQSPAQSPCSGSQCSLFQGWLKAGQLSCHFHWCFRQTLQRAFPHCGSPTLYSFPNPSRPGLSLHIKCSLQILPSQKITHLKLSVAFIWCSHYNSLTLHLYEFPIYLLPEEMYCTTAFLRLLLMVLIS